MATPHPAPLPAYMYETKGESLFIAGPIMLALTVVGLLGRLISMRMKKRSFGSSDILLLFAFFINMAQTVLLLATAKKAGFGHHVKTVHKNQVVLFEKVYYISTILHPSYLGFAKLSILVLLHQIFVTKGFRMFLKFLMVIVGCWMLSITLAEALICQPPSHLWNPNTPSNCGNQHILEIISPLPWIITDFVILVAPLPMVRRLQMPMRQKVALGALFLIGGVTCVVSCVRYQYAFFSIKDPTWTVVDLGIWTMVEGSTTVLCTCLIACKPIVLYLVPDRFMSSLRSLLSSTGSKHSPENRHQNLSSSEQLANSDGQTLSDDSNPRSCSASKPVPAYSLETLETFRSTES